MSSPRILIYLLRRDLRLADSPAFHEISKSFQQPQHPFTHLLPLYVFSAQQLEVSGFISSPDERSPFPEARSQVGGFWRCGPHRAKFLAESVWDLKTSLEGVGSGLVIRAGMVGPVVESILEGFKKENGEVVGVWMTSEEGVEEEREERDVRAVVEKEGKDFRLLTDEKYFIDEYVVSLPSRSSR
jgi:deoxyribodipyrimidine photo-lyase